MFLAINVRSQGSTYIISVLFEIIGVYTGLLEIFDCLFNFAIFAGDPLSATFM